ncbi:EAL domain-containing protein [Pseudomonas turukhanskensis]|uniref:cyclic-guanylate-specific phosphodiesterase n=1 Tax=Pseudomonas turukhanskensis TaxID=1806536 RepID=A0A9W6KA93_9PSED|nr:EAL domain-containing protein [Pseudomonas turukhanskensis]GLK90944.1 bifunctional diguanylate cyclase/phosphodiesterase [Pseudomonas turukhanskensis]
MPRLLATLLLCLAYWAVPAYALTLTEDEQAWLAAHRTLRMGVDATWPPFEYRDEQGRYMGLAADYIALVEKRLGVKMEIYEPSTWSEVLDQARAGTINLLPGAMSTPERQSYLNFTRPYLDFPIVILARTNGRQPRELKDLYGLKIAVVENYAPHELLRSQHPDLNLLPVPNVAAALQALATGQADALVGDLASSVWGLRQLKLEGIAITGETPYRYQLSMAAPKDQPMLVNILDKVFADMTASEIEAMQEHWLGGVLDQRGIWRKTLMFAVPSLLVLLLVLIAVVAVNRRLTSEINRRSALEQDLRTSEQHYRSLVECLSAVTWEANLADFSYSYVSPHAEKLFGYPLSAWQHPDFWANALHPEDRDRTLSYCRAETDAGRDHTVDYRMYAADGRLIWVHDIVTLIEHRGATVLRGVMIEVTETKQIEQALRLSEQKFASVFQQCPDILLIARQDDGRLLEVNPSFELHTGIRAADAIGKSGTELNLWGVPGAGPQVLQRLQRDSLRNLEMQFRRQNGELFTGLISAQPFQLADTPALVVVVRDISQVKQTQEQLQFSEEKFAKAFHASPDGLLLTRMQDGLILEVNEGFSTLTGYTMVDVTNQSTIGLGLWHDMQDRATIMQRLRDSGTVRDYTAVIRAKDGELRLCEISMQGMQIKGERCVLTIARDVTERTRNQEKLQLAATVFESTAEGVLITDIERRITAVNRAFTQITGYSEAEALGNSPSLLASGQHDSAFYTAMWHQLDEVGHWQGEICNKRKNGELYPEWLTISAVRNSEGQITHFVGVFADITSLKHAQDELDHQVHHDSLTGLPNRLLFESRLHAMLADAQTSQALGAVLFLDLDRFKHINDSLGHPVGDILLQATAKRLRSQLRDIDTVARLGGDEFIILLPGLQQASDAERVANKLLTCLSAPFHADGHEFFITASIGASLFPLDGSDVATLIKNADAAMYRSKAKGRNRAELYTSDLTQQATDRIALENELRRAIERNELSLHYQPKQCLQTRNIVGAEALLRWHSPVFGNVPPERFIALAEDNGLILPIGDWVLAQACKQMGEWQQHNQPFGPLSVNLAGAQLRQPRLVERIANLLAEHHLQPSMLQLEITESFIMNQTEEALVILHDLKNLGVLLAIDDFGTGYSSLSYLKRLPLDTLKIDQSFVRGLPEDTHDAAITRAIIALGRSMQLTVIAEGVETPEQERFLVTEGCEQIQGFILSRAVTPDKFAGTFLTPRHAIGTQQTAPV